MLNGVRSRSKGSLFKKNDVVVECLDRGGRGGRGGMGEGVGRLLIVRNCPLTACGKSTQTWI
jgi:hypothetical protein